MIYWTLGNFLKPQANINLPKSPTFLGNFCKGVKIYPFSTEIIYGQLLWTLCNAHTGHTVRGTHNLVSTSSQPLYQYCNTTCHSMFEAQCLKLENGHLDGCRGVIT